MALKWSTGARNFILGKGSFRQMAEDMRMKVYTSPIPVEADDVPTGTLLVTFTKSSLVATLRRGWGEIVKVLVTAGTTGQTLGFDCTVDGGTVATAVYTVPVADTTVVAAHAAKIVRLFTDIGLRACATGQDGAVYVMGHNNQALTIALTAGMTGTVTITDNQYAVDTNDLLRFGPPSAGVISKLSTQTWSGVAGNSGTAAYFRLVDVDDLGTDNTTDRRVQGTVGVGTGDAQISNANITSGATETCDTCAITFPAE